MNADNRGLYVVVRIQSHSQCRINSNPDYDFFVSAARIGVKEKAIDIYSRRGAETAKKNMSPLRSLRLCENNMISILQHRQVFRLYENRRQLSDHIATSTHES